MKLKSIAQFAVALFLSGALIVMAQTPVAASAAKGSKRDAPAKPNDSFRPRGRHLIYVTLPGSLERAGLAEWRRHRSARRQRQLSLRQAHSDLGIRRQA